MGHVLTSIILAEIIAAIGRRLWRAFETQQGHIVGVILIFTRVDFAASALTGSGHEHEHEHPYIPGVEHAHAHEEQKHRRDRPLLQRFAVITVLFGAAA